jgi:hypothetical protein
MIPRPYIAKWQEYAPWNEFAQVEQDLIISRAAVVKYVVMEVLPPIQKKSAVQCAF